MVVGLSGHVPTVSEPAGASIRRAARPDGENYGLVWRPLVYVTGKGGTGKTSVAAALARVLVPGRRHARSGRAGPDRQGRRPRVPRPVRLRDRRRTGDRPRPRHAGRPADVLRARAGRTGRDGGPWRPRALGRSRVHRVSRRGAHVPGRRDDHDLPDLAEREQEPKCSRGVLVPRPPATSSSTGASSSREDLFIRSASESPPVDVAAGMLGSTLLDDRVAHALGDVDDRLADPGSRGDRARGASSPGAGRRRGAGRPWRNGSLPRFRSRGEGGRHGRLDASERADRRRRVVRMRPVRMRAAKAWTTFSSRA
jgi:hypothetical protein